MSERSIDSEKSQTKERETILVEEENTIYELDRECARRHGYREEALKDSKAE